MRPRATANLERGGKWIVGNYGNTLYNHSLSPNATEADCMNITQQYGHMGARSLHGGGINLLNADGAIDFVEDEIDLGIWKSLAGRGNE